MVIRFSRKKNIYPEFSNFHNSTFEYNGITYNSAEAAFHAQKTLDEQKRLEFVNLTPSEAKAKGRLIELRPDWEQVKFGIMCDIQVAKFSQNDDLKLKLLSTGDCYIMEDTTSWHDNVWGACLCNRCTNKRKSYNKLGIAIMHARGKISGKPPVCRFDLNDTELSIDFSDPVIMQWLDTEDGRTVIDSINKKGK